jgi:hypothetical protein
MGVAADRPVTDGSGVAVSSGAPDALAPGGHSGVRVAGRPRFGLAVPLLIA